MVDGAVLGMPDAGRDAGGPSAGDDKKLEAEPKNGWRGKGHRVNISVLLVFVSLAIAITGQLLLKTGMNQVGRIGAGSLGNLGGLIVRVGTNPNVVLGLCLYVMSAVIWLVVLSREELSFVYPLIGTSYILVVLLSKLYFHEEVSWIRWVGVALISLGVIFVTRS